MASQLFSAKELTISSPVQNARCKIPARAAGLPFRGVAASEALDLQTPAMIRFGENTTDEVFISHVAASNGVEIENTGTEPLVGLRYFGPDTHQNLPAGGS